MSMVSRRRRATLALLTLLLVSAPIPAAMAVPGSAPLPLVDEVAAEGAELVISIRPDDPSPTSGATVDWTVTLSNRTGFDADFPNMWLSAGDGLTFDESIGSPPGWLAWTDGTSLSAWSDGGVLAAGETVTLIARTTVVGTADSRVEMSGSGFAANLWWESPRPGAWTNSWVTIDGVGLRGTVTSESGSPLVDVCVNVNHQESGGWWGVRTGMDGSWAMSLPAGTDYRLQFDPKCQVNWGSEFVTGYARQWWPGASTPEGEQPFDLTSTTDIGDVRLLAGGAMSGQVTMPDGFDVESVNVTVEDPDSGWWVDGSSVGAAGTWTISGLPPGDYRVVFRGEGLAEQYYEDATRDAAYLVEIASGTMTTGVDANMVEGAVISGVVTEAVSGDPIENVNVRVVDSNNNWFGGTSTDSDGSYQVTDLASGEYLVVFEHEDYVRTFHDGTHEAGSVAPLQITAGTSTTVDVAMVTGVSVTGAVTAATTANGLNAGDPIPGVAVLAWPGGVTFSGEPAGLAITGPDGSYSLTNLPPIGVGLVFVHGIDFEGGGEIDAHWAASFWPGVGDYTLSTPLDLTAGVDRTGVDAALVPAPVITGSVVDAHGGLLADATPLEGMVVALFGIPGGEPLATAFTNDSGTFQMRSLLTDMGVYLATADMGNAYGGMYLPMWYRNAPLDLGSSQPPDPVGDGATPLVLTGGGTHEVILAYNAPTAPIAPTGLGVAPGDGSLTLTWTVPEGPVESQTILVDGMVAAELAADTGTFVASGLNNGQAYVVEVFATNLGGDSAPASGSGTPTAPTVAPTTTTTMPATTTTVAAPTTTVAPADSTTTTNGGGATTTTATPTSTAGGPTTDTVSGPTNSTTGPDQPTPGGMQPIGHFQDAPPVAAAGDFQSQPSGGGLPRVWLGLGALVVGGSAIWAARFAISRDR